MSAALLSRFEYAVQQSRQQRERQGQLLDELWTLVADFTAKAIEFNKDNENARFRLNQAIADSRSIISRCQDVLG